MKILNKAALQIAEGVLLKHLPKSFMRVLEFTKEVVYYTLDDQMLRKMLREENSVDWSTNFLIAGMDVSHANMIKEVSSDREVNNRVFALSRMDIKNLISNFPSCCITDGQGQPVSWILMYDYCALGLLHTLPEYRGRGYAKVLVNTIVRRLHSEGYPVYCFIEEDNPVSFKLFKGLGFIEDPSYRATWLELNF
ncbi:Glycine N-acyltransferase-like protein 3 [Liparis tanakae]|uniref:Glycine N-acyltransferase-like protein n=1 Tax=Liparis tanakae TaxID=230148 RepID=A0A4Z2ELH2_9TELE|nr:Glycine N-acyltransferase-like protein 3 [Liparis tanakae]